MKFTKEITKLEHSAAKLTVTVAKEDVANGYKTTLGKYVKQVQIPGFRKGHVPASVLERKYGEQIKMEAAGDLIDSVLNEIFQDEKELSNRPLPYAQPKMDEMPAFDTAKEFTFTVTYDVFPSVEVKDFNGISVKEPQVSVGDAEVEEELKGIQERNAAVIDKKEDEKAEKDNIVTIDIEEIGEDGKAVEGTKREGFTFTLGTAENVYKIDDDIIGMKANETKEITKKYAKTDADKNLAGTTKKYSVTVKQIKVRKLPALDDDLAQDVSDKYKTLADLKADILKNLNIAKDRKIKEIKVNSLLEQLIEKNPIEIPASMLQAELNGRWGQMAQQFQTTPEDLERMVVASGQKKEDMLAQWTGDAEKMLKSRIIVDSLLKSKNISVTPEEVEEAYQKLADSNGVSVEDVKKHYADPRAKEWFIDDVKEQKLYDDIFAQIKVAKGDKTSFADLFKAN
ncbi:MAG: trigger factor [Spirochaetales bacterium]|uniref:trigger factor n=1 Tax=Treponema berlinense TaxID=225004 RepID=UPI0023F2A39A|nr:trigger factor [Treponema berlinense]MDD5834140.1 trigger factor [Treponema berlinense]MDO5766274.1 trigger factor [Spirochaetales bacterium]